jgi:ribose transport system ATP-binding protein
VAIILITHRLDEVLAITDRVTVLRDGRVTGVANSADVTEPELVRMIIGTELPARPESVSTLGDTVLTFAEAVAGGVGPLSFEARAGEVLGITGLSGAGHTMVPAMVFGLERLRRGAMVLEGQPFAPHGPADATSRGCSLVPADRNGAGAVPSMNLRENLNLNPKQPWLRALGKQREDRAAAALLREFDVRPPVPSAEFSTLSGGNAQKVVLARCLSAHPRLLVLEEPTAAVDIGARAEIHHRIRAIAASGQAVILVSSDLEEVEQVCDRAIVMERGQIRGILEGRSVTTSALLEAAYGVSAHG